MTRSTRQLVFFTLGAAVLAHIILFFSGLPLAIQGLAVFVLTVAVPGVLLVEALAGRSESPPTPWEHALYSLGAGYGVAVVLTVLLSYLPGPLTRLQTFAAFDIVILLLAAWLLLAARRGPRALADTAVFADGDWSTVDRRWLWAGILTLLLVGGFFRFTTLGYSEYQGDEARAALRAAAILQGYDDVLLIHKKGPTEIALPTAAYALTGTLTEQMARFPFAVANLAALFAVFLLGWRMFNPLAGWIAAMLFALDGYFIGFARIVQYQSVVFLVSILTVLILYRLVQQPRALTRYMTLAAILLATGLLSHYEAALAGLPAVFLLGVLLWQQRGRWGEIVGATVIGGAVGVAMLALFYVPFVRHPQFSATYTYLADRRMGGQFPYNNLADFFLRTTVYSTTYYVLVLVALTIAALAMAFGRAFGKLIGILTAALLTLLMVVTFLNPTWLTVGGTDLAVVPFALILGAVIFLPRMSTGERALWLWFGAGMLLAIFFTEKPRTHVYTFFLPWLTLCGWTAARLWTAMSERVGARPALLAGSVAAVVLVLLFGNYAYWYFIHNQTEVLRTWDDWHPTGYVNFYDEPDNKAIFGFPLANGWKVVGQLYDRGIISGDYETNEKEAWVPAWYTRGQFRCGRSADWYFQIENLEPWDSGDQAQMEHFLRHGFSKWGIVQINDADRMVIYQRTGAQSDMPTEEPTDGVPRLQLADFGPGFDRAALAQLPLTYPAVNNDIAFPLDVNFGNRIRLEGYDVEHPKPLRPGDNIRLTLYWRAQEPIWDSWKVFNQVYFGDSPMIAQRDGFPVCDTRETWRWDPGELITDVYDIPVNADAPDGLYPLYTGLYLEESGDRLPVLDEAGAPIDTQVHVTDIRVGEE
jgi:hypothetical protein